MKHTYVIRLNPFTEIGVCFKKFGSVAATGRRVEVYCKKGHLIRGRLLQTDEEAREHAARLAKKLKVELLAKV